MTSYKDEFHSPFGSYQATELDGLSRASSSEASQITVGESAASLDGQVRPKKYVSFNGQQSTKTDLSRASTLSQAVSEKTGCSSIEEIGPNIARRSLSLRRNIGQGAFAEVHMAELKEDEPTTAHPGRSPSPGPMVAVKQLKGSVDEIEVVNFIEEAMVMQSLHHENIINILGMGSTDTSNPEAQWKSFFLVQEYATGGSLKNLLYKQMINFSKPIYSFSDALRWTLNIATAIEFLHTHDPVIIHRDLKCDNILLTGPQNRLVAKISDFGLHTQVTCPLSGGEPAAYALTGKTGAYSYMAPEVMSNKPYNEKVDVFSFAVILYELFSKTLISAAYSNTMERDETEDHAVKVAAGYRPPFPSFMPASICKIVDSCWATDPKLRPTMTEVVAELKAVEASGVVDSMDGMLTASSSKCCCIM